MNTDLAADPGDDNYDDDNYDDVVDQDAQIEDHPLVVAVRDGAEGVALLHCVAEALARHQAELAWLDLHRHCFDGDELLDRGRAITRSGRALRRLAELEVARIRRFGTQPSVLDGHPQVRLVLDALLERVCAVAHEVLLTEKAHELDARLRETLEADPAVPWP